MQMSAVSSKREIEIILAKPRGFCAGVERAVNIVEVALEKYGAPIYVRHEIVHNKYVVEGLKKRGVVFVNNLDDVPQNSVIIFSAHGVATKVIDEANDLKLEVIDATCPLVTKVHNHTQQYEKENKTIILIGHRGHPEVEGTMGRVNSEVILVETKEDAQNLKLTDDSNVAYVTQTTLSLDDTKEIIEILKAKYPHISGPDTKDICYATQNRQTAVKELSKITDMILVIGAKNSSNSNRLRDLAERNNIPAFLINDESEIDLKWFKDGVKNIGITAGASAPEILVQTVIDFLNNHFSIMSIREVEIVSENIKFKLPPSLLDNGV